MNPCFLKCNEFGTLWPRPREVIAWNNTLLSLNRTNIAIRRNFSEKHTQNWEQSFDRFFQIIDAKIGHHQISPGEHRLFIEVNVANDSMELNLDTNEQYGLQLHITNGDLIARINATTYFGGRHGLETLSQLINFDEFSNQLKVFELTGEFFPYYNFKFTFSDTIKFFY